MIDPVRELMERFPHHGEVSSITTGRGIEKERNVIERELEILKNKTAKIIAERESGTKHFASNTYTRGEEVTSRSGTSFFAENSWINEDAPIEINERMKRSSVESIINDKINISFRPSTSGISQSHATRDAFISTYVKNDRNPVMTNALKGTFGRMRINPETEETAWMIYNPDMKKDATGKMTIDASTFSKYPLVLDLVKIRHSGGFGNPENVYTAAIDYLNDERRINSNMAKYDKTRQTRQILTDLIGKNVFNFPNVLDHGKELFEGISGVRGRSIGTKQVPVANTSDQEIIDVTEFLETSIRHSLSTRNFATTTSGKWFGTNMIEPSMARMMISSSNWYVRNIVDTIVKNNNTWKIGSTRYSFPCETFVDLRKMASGPGSQSLKRKYRQMASDYKRLGMVWGNEGKRSC